MLSIRACTPKLPYVNDKAFAPIILIGRGPNVLVVRADSPYKTVKDVIAAAKAAPNKLTYASQGNGTSAHLAGEMFNNLAKVEMTHVPYKGAGPAITDLLGGQVNMIFGTAAAVSSFVDSGKLRAIAVTGAVAHLPSRTCRPSARPYRATLSRAGTDCMRPAALRPPSSRNSMQPQRRPHAAPTSARRSSRKALSSAPVNPAELETYVHAEEARWRKIVKEDNIKLD